MILFGILCKFHSTEDSGLKSVKHFVCRMEEYFATGRKHLFAVIMLHVLSMTNEPSYTFNFDACVGIAF